MKQVTWRLVGLIFLIVVAVYWLYSPGDSGTRSADQESGVSATRDASGGQYTRAEGEEGKWGSGEMIGGIRSPIELELTVLSSMAFEGDDSGGEVVVGVSLRPLIDSPDMRWFIKVPEGLSMTSGNASWEGTMEKGEEKEFQLTFAVPDGGRYELYSRAEIYRENGDLITKGAGLRIDLGPEEVGDYPSFERVSEDGRRSISYKGRTREGNQ